MHQSAIVEYYQRPFWLLHSEIKRIGFKFGEYAAIRGAFWQNVPRGMYDGQKAIDVLRAYHLSLEGELARCLSAHCIAYWLHCYRRLAPEAPAPDATPMTTFNVRATLEAAIQKYASFTPCSGIGLSSEIPVGKILRGLLLAKDFERERAAVQSGGQLVLTDFGPVELMELYEMEKLAFEVWRTSAMRRIVAKGAPIEVTGSPDYVFDSRDSDLQKLVESYDARLCGGGSPLWISGRAVTFDGYDNEKSRSGFVVLSQYNVQRFAASQFNEIWNRLSVKFPPQFIPNFIWFVFNLGRFHSAHRSYRRGFEKTYGVALDSAMIVLASLLCRIFSSWKQRDPECIYWLNQHWQRAYEGPRYKSDLIEELRGAVPHALQLLDIRSTEFGPADVTEGMKYWTASRPPKPPLDIFCQGPHSIFLPYGDRLIVDYGWILHRLFNLFLGVPIENEQFKGSLLEDLLGSYQCLFKRKLCKANDGSQKEVDVSFGAGKRLILIECKAKQRAISFERGDIRAYETRVEFLEGALVEADEKARWLSRCPSGRNYNISSYEEILPIVCTPFVEFTPSLNKRYWLTDQIPRILTPTELLEHLRNGTMSAICFNTVPIGKPAL